MVVRGWTPSLTPEVEPDDFADAVEVVGIEKAAFMLGVTTVTVERWMIGLGMPNPSNQVKIRSFMRRADTWNPSSRARALSASRRPSSSESSR